MVLIHDVAGTQTPSAAHKIHSDSQNYDRVKDESL